LTGALIIILLLITLLVVGVRIFMRRTAEQRAAHDARLAAMAQTYLVAAKKKAAADAKAAASAVPQSVPVPSASGLRDERECPFCAEPILKKARVCKHCGRDVEPLA
jgi:predicted lipid-binding transport protein (Tim44 family)